MKKRTFLSKLHRNGLYCIIGALILLLGVPLYQFLLLIPSGYSNALATQSLALRWINAHSLLFLGYRALLIAGFALIISLPFSLFRIIIAQEVLGREEEDQERDEDEDASAEDEEDEGQEQAEKVQSDKTDADGMPEFAWRGKGYAVLAAWSGLIGTASPILLVLWCSYRKKWTKSLARGMGRVWLHGSSPRWALQRKRCRSCLCPHRWPGAANYPSNPPFCRLGPLVRCDARSPETRVRTV